MDRQEEYHDPDYPEALQEASRGAPMESEDEKVEKIKSIIRREFSNDLESREHDIMLIDQRCVTARRMLHRLRYALVNNYYNDERLKLTGSQIQDEVAGQSEPRAKAVVSSLLTSGQRRLHPSVRKLLGKQSSSLELQEILFNRRPNRNNTRKDYSAMVQFRNYTISADTTKTLRPPTPEESTSQSQAPGKPKRVPKRFDPKITNVVTLDEATRNQMKHRYRIIIGNTSKYAPPASAADRSTHKWLLYVRGAPPHQDVSALVTSVTVTLHHSYAPHHTLTIHKPPFHISRRGWGEFPAQVELHFALPERNRPASLQHTIKLDRQYTGFQTLGAETVVDVWLYSTEEMLQYEYKEDLDPNNIENIQTNIKQEPLTETIENHKQEDTQIDNSIFNNHEENENKQTESWLDFFSNTTELDVDEMIIKPEKKEDRSDIENLIEPNVISKENHIENNVELENKNYQDTGKEEICDKITNCVNNAKDIEDMPSELLTTSPKKRIMKYMDPTTGKIYYLEMDRKLDLSKVQEIVINSKGQIKTAKISPIKSNGLKNVRRNTKKGGVSLLKPEIKSLLKNETTKQPKSVLRKNFSHIENDHCYLGPAPFKPNISTLTESVLLDEVNIKQERNVFECLCDGVKRLSSVRVAVNFCLKRVPLISSNARDPDFVKNFPFVVETEEKYWKLDFAKRRNIEWSRAKLINRLLTEHLVTTEPIWRTKQILIFSRLHGYFPIRTESIQNSITNESDWSSWLDLENTRTIDSKIKEIYPNASDICTLTKFNPNDFCQSLSESLDLVESDEEIEVVKWEEPVSVKKEVLPDLSDELPVLPVLDSQERLQFVFLERMCADIGIELRNEDVGNGYSYSAVHAVLLSAMKSFAEELVRAALADRLSELGAGGGQLPHTWRGSSVSRPTVSAQHVYRGASRSARLHALTSRALGNTRADVHWI